MTSLAPVKSLLSTLRQPTFIAVLTSVGIHGVLFAASPTFSSIGLTSLAKPDELGTPTEVPMVQLTPAEQGRLPDFSLSRLTFDPNFNQGNSAIQFLPDSSQTVPPGILSRPNNTTSSQSQPVPSTNVPLGNLGVRRQPITSQPSRASGGGSRTQGSGTVASNNRQSTSRQGTSQIPVGGNNSSNASRPPNRAGTSEINPDEIASRTGNRDGMELTNDPTISTPLSDVVRQGATQPNRPPSTPTATARVDGNQADSQASGDLQPRVADFAYNPANTSDDELAQAFGRWVETIQEKSGIADLQPSVIQKQSYNVPYCLPQAPTNAVVGVLINPGGEVVDDPLLLKSSGYLTLNKRALDYVRQLDFSPIQSFTALQYDMTFTYNPDTCAALSGSGQ